MRNFLIWTLTICLVVFIQTVVFAQPAGGGPGGGGGPCPTPPCNAVPIDGGIALLAIAGAAFGIKKIRQNKKGD